MSKIKHTELPWKIGGMGNIQSARGRGIASTFIYFDNRDTSVSGENVANAEFIVKTCNNHYKLIEALKDAHPFVTDDELRISIGKLVAEVESNI